MSYTREAINTAFGRVLKGVLKENDLTQQDAADHLGQSLITVQRILNGKREMTVSQFMLFVELTHEDPKLILDRAVAKLNSMSEVTSNVVPLRRVLEMTDQEREAEGKAAINDDELEQDEHPGP